jgi:hypothetical protein
VIAYQCDRGWNDRTGANKQKNAIKLYASAMAGGNAKGTASVRTQPEQAVAELNKIGF